MSRELEAARGWLLQTSSLQAALGHLAVAIWEHAAAAVGEPDDLLHPQGVPRNVMHAVPELSTTLVFTQQEALFATHHIT